MPGGTRTPDLLLRRQLLYPVELRAACGGSGEMVGATRFERATYCSQSSRATKLRYAHLRAEQELIGRGGGIRTHDPLLPKQMRYQAALRPDTRKRILASPGNPHQINGLYSRDKLFLPEARISDI